MKSTIGTNKLSKRVHFSETSTGVYLRPKTALDLKSSWYTRNEIKRFRANVDKTTEILLDTNPSAAKAYIDQTLVSPRDLNERFAGIEQVCGVEKILSPDINKALCICRMKSRKDVMTYQKMMGTKDAEGLAKVAWKASLFATLWHQRIAVLNWSDEGGTK